MEEQQNLLTEDEITTSVKRRVEANILGIQSSILKKEDYLVYCKLAFRNNKGSLEDIYLMEAAIKELEDKKRFAENYLK